jgi:hypothetical protein
MRKIIVSNLVTLDGYYEGQDKSVDSLFDHFHEDYFGDQNFDFYNAERLRAADFLLLSRSAFLSNQGFWPGVANNPAATAIRREIAGLFSSIEKIVISDKLTGAELSPWDNTRIFKRADAYTEIAALKQQSVERLITLRSPLSVISRSALQRCSCH